jgi:hypothetical protein
MQKIQFFLMGWHLVGKPILRKSSQGQYNICKNHCANLSFERLVIATGALGA